MCFFFFEVYGDHRDLPVLTHSFPTRRSSDLHVPAERQGAALAEAVRVLRRGGLLYVQEPLAEGSYFELMRPIEDETELRARAYDALRAAAGAMLEEVAEIFYRAPLRVKTAEAFLDGRSEEHTSELQSLMRTSYAVFCLKKKKNKSHTQN